MTKQMIIEEMHQVACEERAIEFAINRLDFDSLIEELNELNKFYNKFYNEKQAKFQNNPIELKLELHNLEYRFAIKVMEAKHYYYEKAFFFDSEVMIDFMQWYEGAIDEIEEFYDTCDYVC